MDELSRCKAKLLKLAQMCWLNNNYGGINQLQYEVHLALAKLRWGEVVGIDGLSENLMSETIDQVVSKFEDLPLVS